jgi:hypothetical protein
MNAHGLKTTHVGYGCSSVIHNFPTNQRIEGPVQSDQTLTSYPPSSSVSQAAKGCYDAADLLSFVVQTRRLIVGAEGECIDAETCDGIEARED